MSFLESLATWKLPQSIDRLSQDTPIPFEDLFELAPDATVVIDSAGVMVAANAQVERLFGQPRPALLGHKLEYFIAKRCKQRLIDCQNAYLSQTAGNAAGVQLGLSGLRADGSEFPIEISLKRLGADRAVLIAAVIRDASDCTGTRDSLHKLRDEFEQRVVDRTSAQTADNRKQAIRTQDNETFVYSVSHDLRAPLINLQGFSDELGAAVVEAQIILGNSQQAVSPRLQQLLDVDMPESIHFLRTAATRLGIIIDALLRVSRSGCVEYQHVAVDLATLVARVTDSLSSTVKELGATVITHELPAVIGDPTAIDLIFANLLSNALNYLDPQREGLIEIGTQHELDADPAGDSPATWTLYVKDNGRGIPADSVEKIFQIFQRLHPDSSAGEGIGLTIVRRIIERHSGRIWFESVEGQGTTFYVTLPAA